MDDFNLPIDDIIYGEYSLPGKKTDWNTQLAFLTYCFYSCGEKTLRKFMKDPSDHYHSLINDYIVPCLDDCNNSGGKITEPNYCCQGEYFDRMVKVSGDDTLYINLERWMKVFATKLNKGLGLFWCYKEPSAFFLAGYRAKDEKKSKWLIINPRSDNSEAIYVKSHYIKTLLKDNDDIRITPLIDNYTDDYKVFENTLKFYNKFKKWTKDEKPSLDVAKKYGFKGSYSSQITPIGFIKTICDHKDWIYEENVSMILCLVHLLPDANIKKKGLMTIISGTKLVKYETDKDSQKKLKKLGILIMTRFPDDRDKTIMIRNPYL